MKKYDVIVIGGGPGGYVAAIRSAQLGKKTAIIESEKLGGICLNWGCIPTKTLLHNAHVLDIINNSDKYGIEVEGIKVNWKKMIKRSRDVSSRLSKGIEYLIKKNQIDYINAFGRLKNKNVVEVLYKDKNSEQFKSENIIIATGSKPKWFDGLKPDGKKIITSTDALTLDEKPKSIVIIGAGAIGVEFTHFFKSFGSSVTLIEAFPKILPNEDEEISIELENLFKKRNIEVLTNTLVRNLIDKNNKISVCLDSGEEVISEKVLIAVGVEGNVDNIGLDNCNISVEKKCIVVNDYMQTSMPNIYAIGDVAGPPWLAHVASSEGITAVEHLAGLNPLAMNYKNVPACTYCYPEVASVGMTEKEAIKEGYKIKVGKFPFRALGKAMAVGTTDGFVKVIYDDKYGEMLGCHIIGAEATNIITEAVIARNLETTHYSLLKTIHPHPTLSEAIAEATADALGEAIHI